MERNKCQKGYQMGSNGVCQPVGGYSTGGYMTRRDRLNMRKNLDMSRGKRDQLYSMLQQTLKMGEPIVINE